MATSSGTPATAHLPRCYTSVCATWRHSRTPDFGVRYLFGRDIAGPPAAAFAPKETALSTAQKITLASLAPRVVYVPATSGWVTSVIMKDLLTRPRRALRSHRPEHHIVVALDAANHHLPNDVLCHAARLQIHLLLIPARLTAADAGRNAYTWPWRVCHQGHSGGHH